MASPEETASPEEMASADETGPQGVAAVDRALRILSAFDQRNGELELADIARITGLYKSTILRLLHSLIAGGLVERRPGGAYVLGHECWRLGAVYRATQDPAKALGAELGALAEKSGLTAGYFIARGEYRICLAVAVPPIDVFHHLTEGDRLQLRQGAAGRLLCAYNGIELEESAQARADGFLFRHGDRYQELSSLAVPVFGPASGPNRASLGRSCRGVISLSGRASLFTPESTARFVSLMQQSARALESHLPEG